MGILLLILRLVSPKYMEEKGLKLATCCMCADALDLCHLLKAQHFRFSYPLKKPTPVGNVVNVAQGNLCYLFCLTVICISELV